MPRAYSAMIRSLNPSSRIVLVMTEVAGHLLRERPLQHGLGDLGKQPVRAEQVHALSLRPAQQLGECA